MAEKDDLVHQIGGAILRSANADGEAWDYAGWVFETTDGDSSTGEPFRFRGETRLLLDVWKESRATKKAFLRLREITAGDDGAPWIKCLAVVRREGKALRLYFEFEDASRWRIGPANAEDALRVLVGDAFPEAKSDAPSSTSAKFKP